MNPTCIPGLLSAGEDPLVAIYAYNNVVRSQIYGINVGQTCITGKYEKISYIVQSANNKVQVFNGI
jgi:hypothetical protein